MQNMIGKRLAERYQIKNLIGKGGMAVVYLAWDVRLEREVAVKMIRMESIPLDQQERILKRFEREAKALGKLNHPNIVSVHDFGKEDGRPYLVMEHLSGGTLKERIGEPMPFTKAARLLIPVAEALGYAHEHGIYHRDVKPANILISETGRTKLTDFGIAKILETEEGEALTGTGVGVGTPEYMAPEQGLGQPVDGRTDEYALGVVLYELLTGSKPYQADTPIAVLVKHVKDPLPSVRELVPGLSQDVEQLLKKTLAKQPDARFADMKTFGSVLTELISGSMQSKAMFVKQPIEGAEPKKSKIAPSVKDSPDVATYDDIQVNPGLTGETKLPVTNSQTRKYFWGVLGLILILGILFGGAVLIGNRGEEKASATAHALAATGTQSAAEIETEHPTWTLTVTPTMTITPTETIEAGSISIDVLLQDDFSNPDTGWEIGEYDGGSVGYASGHYFVIASSANEFMWGLAFRTFENVIIEVDTTQVSAPSNDNNAYGVWCRVQANDDGYTFLISGDGYYAIHKVVDGEYEDLVDWTSSGVINQGNAGNHIRAICDGPELALFVNGERLATATDITYTTGDIALAAASLEGDSITEIHFNNVVVRNP